MVAPLRRWHDIGDFQDWRPVPGAFLRHSFSEQTMNDIAKKFREQPAPAVSGTVE
jgi:hypothetical protein